MKIAHAKEKLLTLFLLAVLVWARWQFQIPCPIREWVGIPCPGCGMSRAYYCLLHGSIADAFHWHAMFWSVPLLGVYYLTDGRLFQKRWIDYTILVAIAVGFVANWVWQLCR